MDHEDAVLLPLLSFATLILFYFVWACMHDIAHGDEGTAEWTVLAICAMAFAMVFRLALRFLAPDAKVAWLIGTCLLISLFSAGAVSSVFRPKYAKDPMLASTFLAAGLPALGLIGYQLVREALRRRARLKS
jgi:peptidoglycan/LPS O-acetylase OafA/YrhL